MRNLLFFLVSATLTPGVCDAATPPASGESLPTAATLIEKAAERADAAETLAADFTYTTRRPGPDGDIVTKATGTLRLRKPNLARIEYNANSKWGKRIVSDGTHVWTISNTGSGFTRERADPRGRNVNVWRLVTVGGFFDAEFWALAGVYANGVGDLTPIGAEVIGDVEYRVVEHRMTGTIQGRDCPFHQKLYFGPSGLIERFTLDFIFDGKPGSEVAELSNLELGEPIDASVFQYQPFADARAVLAPKSGPQPDKKVEGEAVDVNDFDF